MLIEGTEHEEITFWPSGWGPFPNLFFKIKNEERRSFADWLIELTNCGFGMTTDAFLKSVKKFLDKEVRIISFLKQPLAFPTIPQSFVMFYFTMLGYIFGIRLPDYFASAREAYKSLACRSLCTITLLLLCPDTGQHRSSTKILISRLKQRQKS